MAAAAAAAVAKVDAIDIDDDPPNISDEEASDLIKWLKRHVRIIAEKCPNCYDMEKVIDCPICKSNLRVVCKMELKPSSTPTNKTVS